MSALSWHATSVCLFYVFFSLLLNKVLGRKRASVTRVSDSFAALYGSTCHRFPSAAEMLQTKVAVLSLLWTSTIKWSRLPSVMVKVLAACLGQMLAFSTDCSSVSSANSKKEEGGKKALKGLEGLLQRNNCDFSGVLSGCCFSAFVASERGRLQRTSETPRLAVGSGLSLM